MLKVAVTGGSGFVGRYVLASLLEQPVEVMATYRGDIPPDIGTNKINWVQLGMAETDAESYEKLGNPDILIHLAWGGLPNYRSEHHTGEELDIQTRFLETMLAAGLKHLTVVGTCFEYGQIEGELSENDPLKPHLAYGEAKVRLLRTLDALSEKHDFTLTWPRLFYLYGKGQAKTSLFSQFMAAVEAGDEIFNMSGGEQERDFLKIDKAANMIVHLALLQRFLGAVNICSGKPTTVRSLVEGWKKEMKSDIDLNLGYYPYPDYEAMSFWGSDRKVRGLLREG